MNKPDVWLLLQMLKKIFLLSWRKSRQSRVKTVCVHLECNVRRTFRTFRVIFHAGNCKTDWVSFQSSCYLFSSSTSTWRQAEQQCASHGGHLLVLNTIEELVSSYYTLCLQPPAKTVHPPYLEGHRNNVTRFSAAVVPHLVIIRFAICPSPSAKQGANGYQWVSR